ncbi:MAG TPA: hypothetical protein VHB21_25680, partial [Minicystis sp.]|nr:hypothetical protein [Minicystis sp.]
MRKSKPRAVPAVFAAIAVAAAFVGCGSEPVKQAPPVPVGGKQAPPTAAAARPARDGGVAPTGTENLPPLPL